MKTNLILFMLLFLVSCGGNTLPKSSLIKYNDTRNNVVCYSVAGHNGGVFCIKLDNEDKKEIAMLNVEIIRLQAELAKSEAKQ